MLYQAIRLGSMIYRCDSVLSQTNIAYRELLQEIDRSKWDQPSNLDEHEVEKVRKFVNGKLLAKMQATTEDIQCALTDTLLCLNELRRKTILNVNFDKRIGNETVGCLIRRCFDKLARCNPPRTTRLQELQKFSTSLTLNSSSCGTVL